MATKYDYPANCTTKAQRRAYRKKMRNSGQAPPEPRKQETKLAPDIGAATFDATETLYSQVQTLITGIRKGTLVVVCQPPKDKTRTMYHVHNNPDGQLRYILYAGQRKLHSYTHQGRVDSTYAITKELTQEIIDRAFVMLPRSTNKAPFSFKVNTKARELEAHFKNTRLWFLPGKVQFVVPEGETTEYVEFIDEG